MAIGNLQKMELKIAGSQSTELKKIRTSLNIATEKIR